MLGVSSGEEAELVSQGNPSAGAQAAQANPPPAAAPQAGQQAEEEEPPPPEPFGQSPAAACFVLLLRHDLLLLMLLPSCVAIPFAAAEMHNITLCCCMHSLPAAECRLHTTSLTSLHRAQ